MIPVAQPGRRRRDPRVRPAGLRAVALQRLLGRPQVRPRHGQHRGLDRARPGRARDPPRRTISRCRRAASTSAGRTRRSPRRSACTASSWRRRARSPAPTGSTGWCFDSPRARLGIVTTGKSYLDVRQALDDLGIDARAGRPARAARAQARPGLAARARAPCSASPHGLEQIVVVEEKRGLIETQLKELLYGRADAPRSSASATSRAEPLFPSHGALSSNQIAVALAERILRLDPRRSASRRSSQRCAGATSAEASLTSPILRTPYFCSGCPHNTSTRVPEGSIAKAGIGCHYMAQWMDRSTTGLHPDGRRGRQLGRRGAVLQARATCSRTSATAPTTTRACWRSAPRSPPASTSPTRSCTTTRSR